MRRVDGRVVLKTLAVLVGTFHGLVGLLGLVLFRTGPEHWSVLTMSVALVSTPAALMLGALGRPRLAAAWLALAALVWAVTGYRGLWPEWRYVALYYGPQLVAALLLLRQTVAATALSAASPTEKTPAATPGHLVTRGLALVLGLCHAGLGVWLVVAAGVQAAWTPGWWMASAASLLSTLPVVVSQRNAAGSGGHWLIGAAYLGVLATGRAVYLSPLQWAAGLLVWWLPQLLLGVVLLRRHRRHQVVTTLRDQQSALTALQRDS